MIQCTCGKTKKDCRTYSLYKKEMRNYSNSSLKPLNVNAFDLANTTSFIFLHSLPSSFLIWEFMGVCSLSALVVSKKVIDGAFSCALSRKIS